MTDWPGDPNEPNSRDNPNNFKEPDNGSDLNTFWMKFSNWYSSKAEGLRVSVSKTKEGISAFFSFRKRF